MARSSRLGKWRSPTFPATAASSALTLELLQSVGPSLNVSQLARQASVPPLGRPLQREKPRPAPGRTATDRYELT